MLARKRKIQVRLMHATLSIVFVCMWCLCVCVCARMCVLELCVGDYEFACYDLNLWYFFSLFLLTTFVNLFMGVCVFCVCVCVFVCICASAFVIKCVFVCIARPGDNDRG